MKPNEMTDEDDATLDLIVGCEQIDLILPDMNGLLRGKRVTRDALDKVYQNGICLPMSLIGTDVTGNTVEETGLGYDIGDEDRICRPIPGTLRPIPWQGKPMAQALLQMEDGKGGLFEANPREVLKRVVDRFKAKGLTPVVAVELEFYLFDDSFSALDFKTDVALRRALKAETDNATVIIVAQRISTVLHANQILVLDEGRLVGKGTHAQLMASCPEYQEIARSQLSQKELDLEPLNTEKEGV